MTSNIGKRFGCGLLSAARKIGASVSFRRTYKPIATKITENKNGIRHAHSAIASCPKIAVMPKNTPFANSKPSGAPNCGKVPYQPRLPSGAFSTATNAAPPHSPPKPIPCPIRHKQSKIVAQIPMLS